MADNARASVLALFFVLGMAFMAAIFMLGNPQWAEHERVRIAPGTSKEKVVFVEGDEPSSSTQPVKPAEKTPVKEKVVVERSKPVFEQSVVAASREPAIDAAQPVEIPQAPPPKTVVVVQPVPLPIATSTGPIVVSNLGGPGTLRGRVVLEGTPPPEKEIPLDAACRMENKSEEMKTRFFALGPDKGLADVVVKVVSPIPFRHWVPPSDPLILASFRCRFEPYVSAIQAGQGLVIENRDGVMHNAHIISSRGDEKNYALLPNSKPLELRIEYANDLRIKCDVHPWEFAYVTKVEHPFFAVTDARGKFEIKGLATGRYTVEAEHRRAGKRTLYDVEVGPKGGFAEFKLRAPGN